MTQFTSPDTGRALLAAALTFPDRFALSAAGERLTYRDLFGQSAGIAAAFGKAGIRPGDCVAVLAGRNTTAYGAVLAAVLAGCCYVPLNHKFPPERNRRILERSGASALIIDDECAGQQGNGLGDLGGLLVVTPESNRVPFDSVRTRLVPLDMPSVALEAFEPRKVPASASPLYLLFTSGTTGQPKGVPISHANLAAYLAAIRAHVPVGPEDRVLQAVDLTFDLSVHDMMLTWTNGAELYAAPDNGAILAPRLIAANDLTTSLIVPSAAARAIDYGLVKPEAMPSLRYSLFAGEALPVPLAEQWQHAAPNAVILNLYGPTEATIHTTFYPFDARRPPPSKIMPIGWPLGEQKVLISNHDGSEPVAGEAAEIFLSGPQLTAGYWKAPHLDEERFVLRDGTRWYRTGDLGRLDPEHGILFSGRADRQMKMRGYRVELQEIEGTLRDVTGRSQAAVLGWPVVADGAADGIVGFVTGDPVDAAEVQRTMRKLLPPYMVPDRIEVIEALPLNANGKTDYRALATIVAEEQRPTGTAQAAEV
ncbi:amino acid adenylation domain-containing protein [Brucella intermedia]|uniref:amino acid adenylation domain-containing protein n=1 Tax=Brucella intermedia TaxID=94625 RepID=UPI00224992EA|nr:amino acid adenylation domain-containing protein [Brucella intermedia]